MEARFWVNYCFGKSALWISMGLLGAKERLMNILERPQIAFLFLRGPKERRAGIDRWLKFREGCLERRDYTLH